MDHLELLLFFLVVSFVYASVGFGGGSSYLAIMAMYALPFKELRLIALVCNIIVVSGGVMVFLKNKKINLRKILPIVLLSVPAAYFGAKLRISQHTFFIVLGCSLLVASVFLWIDTKKFVDYDRLSENKPNLMRDGALGAGIGFLSGMVGIGGGIFLAPLLNLLKWDSPSKVAATASMFILVNSVSGLIGQMSTLPSDINITRIMLLCGVVLVGGQLGSRFGASRLKPFIIRRLTAILVLAAGINVLFRHLPWFN